MTVTLLTFWTYSDQVNPSRPYVCLHRGKHFNAAFTFELLRPLYTCRTHRSLRLLIVVTLSGFLLFSL